MLLEQLDIRDSGYLVKSAKTFLFIPKIHEFLSAVKVFFQKDDNSRLAGKRKTVPRFKVKKQKKCLNVDIKETAFVLNTEIYNVRQTN